MYAWRLEFTVRQAESIAAAVQREGERMKRPLRREAWAFQQVRNALGAWSRQRETLEEDGEMPLQQQAVAAPGQAPPAPKVLKRGEVGPPEHRPPQDAAGTIPITVQVPDRIWETWDQNYAVMVAVNRLWHGAFPFDTMEAWAEGLIHDAARAVLRSAELEEERRLIHEVYPELG